MINKVVLVGRLTRSPELKTTGSGRNVTSVTIAVDNQTSDANGNRTTSFIPVTAWGKSAEILCNYTKKGSLVGVEGRLNQRSYDRNDGTKAQVVEVVADRIALLESKGSAQAQVEESGYQPDDTAADLDSSDGDLADDDLPFN